MNLKIEKEILEIIKSVNGKVKLELHEPLFIGNENVYLNNCITSGFVSTVGDYVNIFSEKLKKFTNSNSNKIPIT